MFALKKAAQATANQLLRQAREERNWTLADVAEKIGGDPKTIGRWERGNTWPNPHFRRKLCELFDRTAKELGLDSKDLGESGKQIRLDAEPTLSISPISFFSVPYRRNPYFTGREEVLEQLHNGLIARKTETLTQVQTISGLGGIGKTQTAVEYVYRYRKDYRVVLWVGASTRAALISGFADIASLLNLPERNEPDQSRAVKATRRWLEEHTGWLLILDNADDLSMVSDFIPVLSTGHMLITTREQVTGTFAQRIEIDRMQQKEGVLFLLRRSKLIGLDASLDSVSYNDWTRASTIVETMGGLPLALDQAGAYIEETACGLAGYLERYQKRYAEFLHWRGKIATDYPETVETTWSLSFEKVQKAYPVASDLLRACTFLQPDAIPEEFIVEGASELGPILEIVANDSVVLDSAISELRRYSLLKRDPEANLLVIHRLVQEVLRDGMKQDTQRLWAERTVRAISRCFPDVEYKTWSRCQRLLPHALICAELIARWHLVFPEAIRLLDRAGEYVMERAQFPQAEMLFKQALTIREQIGGSEHPDRSLSLTSLAGMYRAIGKYALAEQLFQEALAVRERTLGVSDRKVAESLNNLAMLYHDQGKYTQAEPLCVRALAIFEETPGPNHLDTAACVNNLGFLYYTQGKYEQAEPLYQRSLVIREQILGAEHPKVALSLNNLAMLYRVMGKYEQAEPLFQRALTIREQILVPDHPDIATSMNNLAQLYRDQQKYEQAEPLLLKALAMRKRSLGPNHSDVANSLYNLGKFYQDKKAYAIAEQYFQQALAIRRQVLGPEHPDVATTLKDYADLLRKMKRKLEAAELEAGIRLPQ